MKKIFCLPVFMLFSIAVNCQEVLVFKGTVKCYIEDDPRSTRGAKNVVVVPGFIPSKAGMTGQQGYYELNTAVPLQKLDGKYVMVYYVSSCKQCELKKNVFVSDDQIRQTNKNLSYLTVETVQMTASCRQTELRPLASDSIYNSFIRLPSQDLEKISPLNAVTATPGVLNVLTNIISTAPIVNAGSFFADTLLSPGKFAYGNFLFASPLILTANMGFNFSPNRDLSEAAFWNPSALANSNKKWGASLFTNIKNNGKLSGFVKVNEKFAIGAGGIYTYQDNFRKTRFRRNNNIVEPLHFQELKEYAAYLSPSYKINNKFSAGAAIKSIWQNFNVPKDMEITTNPEPVNDFTDSTVTQQKFDVDVSFTYNITRAFKAGINIMNIAGTKLFADAFPAGKKIAAQRNLRSYGLGLCYKWKQFNFGTDVLVTEDDLYDVSVGVNYIPFNNALLSGGYVFKQQAFAFSFKMKYFRLSYVNDNDLMVNEKKEGKSKILNGQLYSGLVFSF